ncbi:MAG: cation acetate symporter [Spirochaetaceae bacterium]|jgi:cation/acetate symporter|nr:cation acetate symporter [Spirochaetaceae bacterium]
MIYDPSVLPVIIFGIIVVAVLGISFYLGKRTSGAKGYFAAGGTIPWAVNGIAFAGDYLSAASFLGICGMIAFYGYDGFLYSIGYLAGWVVALFVIAEPLKRRGKFTFTDALDSQFNSKGIQLMAAISTLVVSIFYLIPQMVGAGVLVTPLLGVPHWIGVLGVGIIVIIIVATAGMKSTTYVQFIKGALLIFFSLIVVIMVLNKGFSKAPTEDFHEPISLSAVMSGGEVTDVYEAGYSVVGSLETAGHDFIKLSSDGIETWWLLDEGELKECLSKTTAEDGTILYNGADKEERKFFSVGSMVRIFADGQEVQEIRKLNVFSFLAVINDSVLLQFKNTTFTDGTDKVHIWYQQETPGSLMMRPGLKFKVDEDLGATGKTKFDFVSLMIALFFGTAALPHVLIRYYTVPSPKDARKSTILAICAIGFFYILTLYMGLGAAVNGVLDVESSNMAAPLLAKSIGLFLFAVISAVAFATVLGTVSGLIVAASGAVAHDLANFMGKEVSDERRVVLGKMSAVVVGVIAILLGILFKGMNVSFLVGWAFSIAASANFPAILMLLFWKKTTAKGIASSILMGMVSALTIILLSPSMFVRYGMDAAQAPFGIDNPGMISIPLSFITLIVVSLITQKDNATKMEHKD